MDVKELFDCCRTGDLERVRLLVEQRDIDVNIRDKWDSTPLYYACLCGHPLVVDYLIRVGARCEANTFDGERCLYAALTDNIRRLLTDHNLITSHTIRRDSYNEFLRRLYENGEESDVSIILNGREYRLHRCILAARAPYFCKMLSSKWRHRTKIIINNGMIDRAAFESMMKYLYTGRFECPQELVDQCLTVANNLKLPGFQNLLQQAAQRARSLQVEKQGRVRITMVVIEREDVTTNTVDSDLRELAQITLPPEFRVWPTEMPFCLQGMMPDLADVCFIVEELKFMCHKVFFCRSEYFRAIFKDHFHEREYLQENNDSSFSQSNASVPLVRLKHLSAKVFAVMVNFFYCNQIMVDSEETAIDVLYAADMCLLSDLKRHVGFHLGARLTISNVFYVHRLSRLFVLPRLEDLCISFVAKNFIQLAQHPDLRDIIVSDAQEVKERQETDSVTFVDDLRYHMSSNLCDVSDIEDVKDKISILEDILEDLGIEA